MYRIQEHVRKTLPKLEQQCSSLDQSYETFKDLLYGAEQSALAIRSVENSEQSLENVEKSLVQLNNILSHR
jgi:hypothetical protein